MLKGWVKLCPWSVVTDLLDDCLPCNEILGIDIHDFIVIPTIGTL